MEWKGNMTTVLEVQQLFTLAVSQHVKMFGKIVTTPNMIVMCVTILEYSYQHFAIVFWAHGQLYFMGWSAP